MIRYLWVVTVFHILFSLMFLDEITAKNISTDQDALLALKAHITNDPQNLITSNWSTATSVCDWLGITCGTRHHRVTGIQLRNMSLTGTIPPDIGNLSFLANFSLSTNNFQDSLPSQLANLRRLKWFDLGYNIFSGIIPSWIGSFTQLQYLDLSSNNFGGVIPTSLCNLSKLNHLNLGMNNLEGQIPAAIGNLQSLEILYLNNNKLSGGVPIGIFNIPTLQLIVISNNGLSGSIPTTTLLTNMSSLGVLDFSTNNLTGDVPSNMFAHVPALKFLSLRELHSDIGNLTMLQGLYLGYNNFKGEIPKSIGNLVNLEVLSMLRNTIGGKIPSSIGNLTRLKRFNVRENILKGRIPLEMVGYMAPEYGSEGLVSVKGDMYSFGILLMETFTRKRPTDEIFNEEMSIKQWIEYLLPSGVYELADPNLISVNEQHYEAKTNCISSIMDLALKCCVDAPEERISSKEAASALNKIKVKLSSDVQRA
ncbi:Leucine-rich repeat protein kinase family protein [Euphorbia peplus]|nr:Leucine-rich repeat protein kinase family protein [Euphorbia peplus]